METKDVYNPYEGIEYIPFTGRFAVYLGDNRSRNKPLIGVYDTLDEAVRARDSFLEHHMNWRTREIATLPRHLETRPINV
jgi:hypothetical protein